MARKLYPLPLLIPAFAVAIIVLGLAFSRPVVADGLGTVLQRLHLREIQSSPPALAAPAIPSAAALSHPGGISYGDTIWRQTTLADATAHLDFALLVPSFVPPGYAPIQAPATITSGNRDQVRLTYQKGSDAAASFHAMTIIESHRSPGSAQVRPYDVKPGSAEAVRIGDFDGVYVSGDWLPSQAGASQRKTPNLHFVVFERGGTEVWVYASPTDVPKSDLLHVAASMGPLSHTGSS